MRPKAVVHLNNPIAVCLVTYTAHRAAITALCLITADDLYKTGGCDTLPIAAMYHSLSHRADQVVPLFIVVQAVVTERFNAFLLFFVKRIVLDICFNTFFLQHTIVLIRTVAGIGYKDIGKRVVKGFILFNM